MNERCAIQLHTPYITMGIMHTHRHLHSHTHNIRATGISSTLSPSVCVTHIHTKIHSPNVLCLRAHAFTVKIKHLAAPWTDVIHNIRWTAIRSANKLPHNHYFINKLLVLLLFFSLSLSRSITQWFRLISSTQTKQQQQQKTCDIFWCGICACVALVLRL